MKCLLKCTCPTCTGFVSASVSFPSESKSLLEWFVNCGLIRNRYIWNRCRCCLVVEWLQNPSFIQHWYKMSAKHQVCLSLSSQEKRMAPVARLFWDHVVLLVPWCLWHWRCQCSQALLWSFNRSLGQWNIETNGFRPCAAPLKKQKETKKNRSTRSTRKDGLQWVPRGLWYLLGIIRNTSLVVPKHENHNATFHKN